MIDRRSFVGGALVGLTGTPAWAALAAVEPETRLSAWSPGTLDIHHVDTGRGNATFLIGPDGTTMLIDCGTSSNGLNVSAPPRPDATRQPGEWVARYAMRHAVAAKRRQLDYMIATHIHPDHVGDMPMSKTRRVRGFTPTGLSQVDQLMPATTVIDRSYPEYGSLPPLAAPFANNYRAWLDDRRQQGRTVEALQVGSDKQIRLRAPDLFPTFSVRNVAANGRVWTGEGNAVRSVFDDGHARSSDMRPPENSCSVALKFIYGRFSYFTGGDLNADTHDGLRPWLDVESPAARAVGRVEVALANHHGYFDSCGPEFVRQLDPQAFVIPSWHVTHPGPAQLERMLGGRAGEKSRDVFALEMLPENRLFNARFASKIKSLLGHVVVRVAPGGDTFQIYVLDSSVEVAVRARRFGPYRCR